MKLRNKQAGMEIGICHISNSPDFETGYWLYTQVGNVRTMIAKVQYQKGNQFIRTLLDWDNAGGNDGMIEQ